MRVGGMVTDESGGKREVERAMDALDDLFWGIGDRELRQGFEEVVEELRGKAGEVEEIGKRIGERIEEVERMEGGDFVVG